MSVTQFPAEPLPEFPERRVHDILVDIAQLLHENLAELKHIRASLGSTTHSSVELAENAKGVVQVSVKTYVDSPPVDDACTEAVAAFTTLKQEVERGLMQGWRETVEALQK